MYTYEQLSAYFGQLGSYLGSFVLPDFSDLDIGQAIAEGTEEFNDQLARDFEDAVERHNQEQERLRAVAAAELLRAERLSVVDELKRQLGERPVLPPEKDLALLGPGPAESARSRVTLAQQAIDLVAQAPDETLVPAFEALRRKAVEAIETACAELRGLPPAVQAETERRQRVTQQHAVSAEQALVPLPKGWDQGNKPPASIKKLKQLIADKDEALRGLGALVGSASPDEFDAASLKAGELLKALQERAAQVQKLLQQKALKNAQAEHEQKIRELRWSGFPPLGDEQLAVLEDRSAPQALARDRKTYDEAFALLETASAGGFEEAHKKTLAAYGALDLSHEAARKAVAVEIERRKQERRALLDELGTLQAKEFGALPIPGTPGETELGDAKRACEQALARLARLVESAAPAAFAKASKEAGELLRAAFDVRARTAKAADLQLAELRKLKTRLTDAADKARVTLPTGPSSAIVDPVKQAFERALQQAESRIEGKNPGADLVVVEAFEAGMKHVTDLSKSLKGIKVPEFDSVKDNKTIVERSSALLTPLNGKEGIGEAAASLAEALSKKVHKVADQYLEIAELATWHNDLTVHAKFDQAWKPEVNPFVEFERTKDTKADGELSTLIKQFNTKFEEIDQRIRRRERAEQVNTEYMNSEEGKFLVYWDDNGRQLAITELTRLVNLGTATMGDIKRCYLSSHDDERDEEFSVEVSIDIDGRRGVVAHAHCTYDGTPKPGNGAHFKLANNKRESGGTCTLNAALRGALLPAAGTILGSRSACWEGRRPGYV
jgi:hypothetical protein